jgi:peptidoglycan hydrolase CwlO-like protein
MNNGKKFEIVKEEEVTYIKATINDPQGNRIITMQKVDEDNLSKELESLRNKMRERASEINQSILGMKSQLSKTKQDLEGLENDISSLNELLNNK